MRISIRRKYPWDQIDPHIFGGKITLAQLAKEHNISYRQVTNRKYNLRDKAYKLKENNERKKLRAFLNYLNVKSIDKIPSRSS